MSLINKKKIISQYTARKFLSNKSFAVYGMGKTGLSVINYLKKNNNSDFTYWDDNSGKKKLYNLNNKKKKKFIESLNIVDYIIISPGISLRSLQLKKYLIKNKKKIITDIDLFYLLNSNVKSIVVTGTNGKSTTCKIIHHLLKKNKIKVLLGGNIGKPILNLKIVSDCVVVIEASSYQLAYSKFIKPSYALILNISNDHLDWHGTFKKYVKAKMKIFSNQNKNNYALINDKNVIKNFKKQKFKSKLKIVSVKSFIKVKNKIKNSYLNSKLNEENLAFVFALSKIFKIKNFSFIRSLNSFRGLPHRHEIFYKKNNVKFINDSKATSFEASKLALQCNNNILWIVGGLPKLGDKFYLNNVKKNILQVYIIGKNITFYKMQLRGKVKLQTRGNLKKALISILQELKSKKTNTSVTVLLSPSGASFDQYKNFNERGNHFKKLVKLYAPKYL